MSLEPYEPLEARIKAGEEDVLDDKISSNESSTESKGSSSDETENGTGTDESDNSEETVELLPPPSYLVINEIYYDAEGSDTNGDLFIELKGEPGGNLQGYYLTLVNGDDGNTYKTITIEEEILISEDGFFVIADTTSEGGTNVQEADYLTNFDPQNGPDSIQLINRENQLVDAVGYGNVPTEVGENSLALCEGEPAEDVSSGKSLSRIEGVEDANNNFVDFVMNDIPSPGSFEVSIQDE